jgi:hypothetical protein
MKFFEKALTRLDASPLERVATTLEFDHFDADKLAKRLELQANGERRGKANQPSSGDQTFDSIEATIISEIESYRKRALDRITVAIESYQARINAFDFHQIRADVIASISAAEANLVTEVHQGENELFQKKNVLINSTSDLNRFKERHHIVRQAHLPESLWIIWGVVLALFFLEALMNGAFFSGGLEGGFLEGIAVAIGIAFLNVFLGFGVGLFVVRFLNYRNFFIKIFASIGLVFDLVLAVFINVGVAKFRDALSGADPEIALLESLQGFPIEFFASVGELSGFQSYLLIGIGFMFHIVSLFDGFKLDDPYPFYGKYWRKMEESQTDYAETKEFLIEYLTEVRDETVEEMQDSSRSISATRQAYFNAKQFGQQNFYRFSAYLEWLQSTANQLLGIYREANINMREDNPPRHFSEKWEITVLNLFDEEKELSQDVDGLVSSTTTELEQGIIGVNKGYENAVIKYKQIETTLEEELKVAGSNSTKSEK